MARRGVGLALILLVAACGGGTAAPAASPVAAAPSPALSPSIAPSPSPSPPSLSLSGLFHPVSAFSTDPAHVRTLVATGDVIPARLVDYYATQKKDFLWPFRPTADYVKNADVTFANLESPLFAGCQL